MKVFKFGGASVNNVERIKNLAASSNLFRRKDTDRYFGDGENHQCPGKSGGGFL